jgi:hypothetical protein
MIKIGPYTVEVSNTNDTYLHFVDPFHRRQRVPFPPLDQLIEQHLRLLYFSKIEQFITFFCRAFKNPQSFQEFGNTPEEKAFLSCIPQDYPNIDHPDKKIRFQQYVDLFLITFNQYSQTTLTKEEVLPYIAFCQEYDF